VQPIDVPSMGCELSIVVHTHGVNCVVQLLDGRLCSGSDYKKLEVWNKYTGACELSLETEDCVRSIAQLRDGRVCAGDSNGDIQIWNLNTRLCEMTLDEYGYNINAVVIIDGSKICSCSHDTTIKVWNSDTWECVRTFIGHENLVNFIVLLDGRICSLSYDGILKIWNTDTGVCDLGSHVSDERLGRVLQLHDGRLLIPSSDEVFLIGA
jgi:WD domain, G-beta repeat